MKILFLLVAMVWLPFTNTPQQKYLFKNNSKVTVAGTSTLHDWTMVTQTLKGEADIELSGNEILSIREVKVEIPVESLKSGKNKMDKNAWRALKSDKYPAITFQLKDFEPISVNGGSSVMEVNGHLTIAGKTKPEKILVKYRTDRQGNLVVSGSKDIKMTDYKVTPPEVMFGTVTTGDAITISFDLYLAQKNSL